MPVESDRINAILERDSKQLSLSMLKDLATAAQGWKPAGYDSATMKRRAYYEGKAEAYLRSLLMTQFPKTHNRMHALPVNVLRHLADQKAAVYKGEPVRSVFVGDADAPDEQRSAELTEAADRAQLSSIMQETERRTVLSGTGFLRIGVHEGAEMLGRNERLDCQFFWPSDVGVIPHPGSPASVQSAVAVILRIAGPNGLASDVEWFEVWTRPYDGESLGPLSVEHISSEGDTRMPFGSTDAAYPLPHLPIVRFSDGIPQGSPFLDADADDLCVADAVHQLWTDQLYKVKMQDHGELIYKGSQQKADFVGGPGAVMQIGDDESLESLSYPDTRGKLDTVQNLLAMFSQLNRVSPEAFASDGQASVNSGIDRVIANLPQTEARQERVAFYKASEENELLPIMAEVSDEWLGTNIGSEGVRFDVKHAEPENYEDPEAKQRRVVQAKDAGFISDARAAVEDGWYDTIADAEEAGLSNELKGSSEAPAAQMFSLRDRLSQVAAQAAPEPAEDDDEDEAA